MLVLTRKENEKIVIGEDVTITVVSIGPGRVKIGINAPKWMTIDRQEVHDKKATATAGSTVELVDIIDAPVQYHNRLKPYETVVDPKKPR